MGLALSLGGVAYLVWVLVVGVARELANELSRAAHVGGAHLAPASRWLSGAILHAAPVFDVVGVLWLGLSLVLIAGASRQRWSISWPWLCAICQAMLAALLGAWTGLAGGPAAAPAPLPTGSAYPTAGWAFMSVSVAVALVLWVATLVWLLYERARLGRGPSLRDGLRTHVPG